MKKVTTDIYYVGVNDHQIDLFEGQYIVPNGMAYNSYVIMDERITIMDSVDIKFTHEWLDNIEEVLGDKEPYYFVIQHMEPDHSANIAKLVERYPNVILVGNVKTFQMLANFFPKAEFKNKLVVENGDKLPLGAHELTFVFAPMVHWPEVMVTYDDFSKVLFSADGFGKFGALDVEEEWACEARRYYFGIVGKYGMQVQKLLEVASKLEIKTICPLHGPILNDNLGYYINLYNIWSKYLPESEGIVIAYTSVYGHTKEAVLELEKKLKAKGCPKVVLNDLARVDMAEALEDAFRYEKIIFATTTYNSEIFPFMSDFLNRLVEHGFQNKTVGFIENGTWAPNAIRVMQNKLASAKNITYLNNHVTILSSLNDKSMDQLESMAEELCKDYTAKDGKLANKQDLSALFKIGYGLYVVTSNDGRKDNGLIVNAVLQVTNTPNRIAVTINKDNYSHHIIKQTGKMNVCCLSTDAPFSVFQQFGFQSGRNVDKFKNQDVLRSDNGLVFLPKYINSFMSLNVEEYIDLGTHGMFICSVTEARVISDKPTMTYTYYFDHVKPKPQVESKKGWVCKICGFVYEGEELPEDYVCPLCKHGASDFERIE
ncbi:MAG: flavin reductase [Erysipelotrichales bacterium]|nr:flavin reductase [Erysipelotrichales bacterium]